MDRYDEAVAFRNFANTPNKTNISFSEYTLYMLHYEKYYKILSPRVLMMMVSAFITISCNSVPELVSHIRTLHSDSLFWHRLYLESYN